MALLVLTSVDASGQSGPTCAGGDTPRSGTSPRISALAQAVADSGPLAVDAFWRAARASRTPLIEAADSSAPCVVVTFVHRDAAADSVAVFGGFSAWADSLRRLERMPGTNLWFRTLTLPADIRAGYQFRVTGAGGTSETTGASTPRLVLDTLNPHVDSILGRRSVFVGPRAPSSTWSEARPGIARGRVEAVKLSMRERDTSVTAWVYTPPGYETNAADSLPLLVLFDGGAYVAAGMVATPVILDNLIAGRRITPVIALFLPQETTPAARQAIMGNNAAYARFVAEDVIPFVRTRYRVTDDPSRVVIGGSSLGGLAASYVALRYPSVVRNVLSQSGSYQWPHPADPEPEWLTRWVARAPTSPIRFYIEAGRFEVGGPRGLSLIGANRRFRDVLRERGYAVTYREVSGGHEYLSWRVTLAEALPLFFGSGAPTGGTGGGGVHE